MLAAADEGLHDWPREAGSTWKENYYWNLADRQAGIWGFAHISLVRTAGLAVFSAVHMIDGRVRFHRNQVEIGPGEVALDDGTLSVEVVEPFEHHRLKVAGRGYRLELDYRARFEAFSYSGRGIAANRAKIPHLRQRRYEQGMKVSGICTFEDGSGDSGRTIAVDCLGHRDHSWGRREESKIDGWNWAAVQLPEKTINITRSFSDGSYNVNGFISSADGNVGVCEVEFDTLETEDDGRTPMATRYRFRDDLGRNWTLVSRRFSDLFEPMRAERDRQSTVIYENFADYLLEETGEAGWGIDEYQRRWKGT